MTKSYLNDFLHADLSLQLSGRRQQSVRLDVSDKIRGRAHQGHAVTEQHEVKIKNTTKTIIFNNNYLKTWRISKRILISPMEIILMSNSFPRDVNMKNNQ